MARANRLVGAYIVSLAILLSAIIAGYMVLREEMLTQRNLSSANTHINIIHRTINESVSLLQDYRDAAGASQANTRLVQVIEQRINTVIEELDTRASLLNAAMLKLEESAHWDDIKLIKPNNVEHHDVLLDRYVKRMRELVRIKDELGQAFKRPQIPAEAAGARYGALSSGYRKSSEQLSEIIVRHSNRVEAVHQRLTFLVIGMFFLMSFLIVLPLWKRLISEHKRHELAHKKLNQFAYTDQETGLPNLDGFEQYSLRTAIPWRTVNNHYLLLIRIKNLYEIYNLIGSQRISELHQMLSERLRSSQVGEKYWSRSSDSEYATVIHKQKYIKSDEWMEQFFNELSKPVIVSGILVRPLVAIAASQLKNPETSGSSLLREQQANARMALPYFDRTTIKLPAYEKTLTHELTKQNELITNVTNGVDNKEFVPFYQIKVDAITGEPRSMEALCRWIRADEVVGPHMFISAAEKSGQIVPMTYQLLEQIVGDAQVWSKKGLSVGPIAINVSIDVLQHKGFIAKVSHSRKMLLAAGSDLEIEITENVAIEDSAGAIRQILQQLSKSGIRIAIDDFGIGYASLQTLIDLPFDVLKIDRSFVVSMTEAGAGSEVLSAMISLSSKLDKRSVIEGVEYKWQKEKLAKMGADELQGFYFHRPASAVDVSGWLLNRSEKRHAGTFG